MTAADEEMSENVTENFVKDLGLPATGREEAQISKPIANQTTLQGNTQSEYQALSVESPNIRSSRSGSPLSDLGGSPSSPEYSWMEESNHGISSEQLSKVKTLLSTFWEEMPPYPYTDFNSFVPSALSSYRPINLDEGDPSSLDNQVSLPEPYAPSTNNTSSSIRRKNTTKASRFFPKPPVEKTSCIPFPALNASSFGLVQERLSNDPFRLLVAVMFLNKTRGKVALPVCYDLFDRYPTPESLANATFEELSGMIHELGLQNQRAERMIKLAQVWVERPPRKGQRYRMLHYPGKEDGKDVPKGSEPVNDEDVRSAWEIAHLPGTGAYAMDSWRIFCRDELRGLPSGLRQNLDAESIALEMEQEWTRVLPLDKELRAYLRWRWLRLGWTWNPLTGEREKLDQEVYREMEGGGVAFEGDNNWSLEGINTASDFVKGESVTDMTGMTASIGTIGTKAQIDIASEITEELGNIAIAETQLERQTNHKSAELPTILHVRTASNQTVQENGALYANTHTSDNTDSTSEAISAALQWLQDSEPGNDLQGGKPELVNGIPAAFDAPILERTRHGSNEPLSVSQQNIVSFAGVSTFARSTESLDSVEL